MRAGGRYRGHVTPIQEPDIERVRATLDRQGDPGVKVDRVTVLEDGTVRREDSRRNCFDRSPIHRVVDVPHDVDVGHTDRPGDALRLYWHLDGKKEPAGNAGEAGGAEDLLEALRHGVELHGVAMQVDPEARCLDATSGV